MTTSSWSHRKIGVGAPSACDHKHCNSRDVFNLSRDLVNLFKGLYELMGGSPSWRVLTLPIWCHWSIASGDIKYLICHMNSQSNVIERSSNFMSRNSLWYATILPSLMGIDTVVVKI